MTLEEQLLDARRIIAMLIMGSDVSDERLQPHLEAVAHEWE